MSGFACARLQKWCLLVHCTSSERSHGRLRNRDVPAASVRYRQVMVTRVYCPPNNNYSSCNNYLIWAMNQYKPSRFRVLVSPIPLLSTITGISLGTNLHLLRFFSRAPKSHAQIHLHLFSPSPTPPPPTMLNTCTRYFYRVSTLYWGDAF